MKIKNDFVAQLKQNLKESQILTDLEDCYVYSFEKFFLDPAYPKPDVVVKVSSLKEKNIFLDLIEKEDVVLIKRGKEPSHFLKNSPNTIVLLDNVKIPKIEINIEKKSKKDEFTNDIHELYKNEYGGYKNLALAIKNLLFGKNLNKCQQQQCRTCSGYCTVASSFNGIETWSAKGRILIARGLLKGELPISEKIVDIFYSCTKCGLCFSQCFQNLDFHEAILGLRRYIAEKNMVPQPFHTAAKNIFEYGDPGAIPIERRLSRLKNISKLSLPEKADTLYWVGCTVASRTPKTAKAFFNILNRANVNFTMLGKKEGCCGYVLVSSGLWEEAKKVASEVIERVEKTKAKILITTCAGCYYTFTRLFPEVLNLYMPCEILHASQYIEKLLENEKIKLKPLNMNSTYHDPCSLGRHSKVYDAPRNVLKAIPNFNLIEMPHNKNYARCCGGGGGLWTFNYRLSMESAYTRLKEDLIHSNINTLTTACPLCQTNFRFASRMNSIPKNSIKIYDITEMIELAM